MAPEGRMLFVDASRVFVASEPIERVHCVIRQVGRQPHSTARLQCAPATLHTQGSWATRKREHVTFIRRDGKWRCTGSSCLPAPAGSPPRAGSASFLSGGGTDPAGTSASFALSLAGTSAIISVFIIVRSRICHCRGCVSFSGALQHFPVFSCSPRHVNTETWRKDLISLGKRRQILRVHIKGCISLFVSVNHQLQSLCCDFQTSQGSQIELIKTRRFLGHVTQTTGLVNSRVLATDVFVSQKTFQPLPWTAPTAFPWLCRRANM